MGWVDISKYHQHLEQMTELQVGGAYVGGKYGFRTTEAINFFFFFYGLSRITS